MSARRLLHIPRHTLRITAYLLAFTLLVGTLLFFALTRTQIGRDGLRRQIQKQFAETFEGRLEIGRLTGNLVQDLFAGDVRFYDPEGRLVLQVDSLVAQPNLTDLLRRRFSVGSMTLIQPTFHLLYQNDSTWNVAGVFRKRVPQSAPSSGTWSFDSADLNVVNGTVHTAYEDVLPPSVAAGWLFNIAATEAENIQARTTIEWGTDVKLIDFLDFSGTLPDVSFTIDNLQGQLVLEKKRTLVNQLTLEAGRTSLTFDGSFSRSDTSASRIPPDETLHAAYAVDLELHESRLDADQLHRLFPGLSMSDEVTASAKITGPVSALVVESLTLQRGQTRLRTDGTLQGLPDSLHVSLALRNNTADANDLDALFPAASFSRLAHLGPMQVQGSIQGTARRDVSSAALAFHADADLDVRGAPGHLGGTLSVRRRPGRAMRYTARLSVDSLNIGRLVDDDRWTSRLKGRFALQGQSVNTDSLNATVRIDLAPSVLASRQADSVHVDASITGRRIEATAFAQQNRQGVFANAVLNLNAAHPRYRLGLITRQLDLGPLLAVDSLHSTLNTQWSLEGVGTSWDDVRGNLTVTFDSSLVQWGTTARALMPQRAVLTINDPDVPEPRLQIAGEALTLNLDSAPSASATAALLTLWRSAWDEAWSRQAEKTYDPATLAIPASDTFIEAPSLDQIRLQEKARQAMHSAGLDTLHLDLSLAIKRPELVTAFFPMIPPILTDLNVRTRLDVDSDRLHLTTTFKGDSLRMPGLYANTYQADLQATIALDAPVEQTLRLALDAHTDTLSLARQTFNAPQLSARYHERRGDLTFSTERNNGAEAARLTASVALLPDRYRLTLEDFDLVLGAYVWRQADRQTLDLFTNAVVIPGIAFESQPTDEATTQRVRLRGALSPFARDTLFAEIEDIGLRQLSDFAALQPPLGGQLNASIALTGASQRELTGILTVDALSLDNRLLGHLKASSRYVPGSPDIALDVSLLPIPLDDPLLPKLSPNLRRTENQLNLAGMFRLPQDENDPGALNLTLDVTRADAFFFEYILSDVDRVEGAFAGGGAIRGTFAYPLFAANLNLTDGRFDVPKFNLRYWIDGPVSVDDEGIKLDQVVLRDTTQGTAVISGGILFNDYRFFSFDLSGQLRDIQIINVPTYSRELPFYGTIWASGDVTMTGPLYHTSLRSTNVVTSDRSKLFIPITTAATDVDPGFIVYADSTGKIPDASRQLRRENILASRPVGERTLVEGMEMDLNILAPQGSTVHLVIDPLLGDVINAVGSGRIQLQRQEGDFSTFGRFDVASGDYLFTASEVFIRRFLINEGSIIWAGDPLNPSLDISAAYQTRASRTGLPPDIAQRLQSTIPLIVNLHITGELNAVLVDLNLAVDRSRQETISNTPYLENYINQPDRAAEYATSVLLTNSFLLTTESPSNDVLAGSAFNSVSALVSSQLNRYLSEVIPNADFTFGVQSDETADDLDVSAGVAIRLLNERLVIRGQGVYSGLGNNVQDTAQQGLQGEFVVEIRLNPSVSVEVFYRREGDVLSESLLTSETGAGLSYRTQFSTWRTLFRRLLRQDNEPEEAVDTTAAPVVDVEALDM